MFCSAWFFGVVVLQTTLVVASCVKKVLHPCEGYFFELWWDKYLPHGLVVASGGSHKQCYLDLSSTCLPKLINVVDLGK